MTIFDFMSKHWAITILALFLIYITISNILQVVNNKNLVANNKLKVEAYKITNKK